MTQHIFEYLPHSKTVCNREYLFKCEECINLIFHLAWKNQKELALMKRIKKLQLQELLKLKSITTVN